MSKENRFVIKGRDNAAGDYLRVITFARSLVVEAWACAALFLLTAAFSQAQTIPANYDWNRALVVLQKFHQGDKLTAEESAFLDQSRQTSIPGAGRRPPPGLPQINTNDLLNLKPLTELGDEKYRGEEGGLYGNGRNEPSQELQALAERETQKIHPLDGEGKPSDSGKVVLLSLGMINTAYEFGRFQQMASVETNKSKALVIVNGAQPGYDIVRAVDPAGDYWTIVNAQLAAAGVTPGQVQVLWIKQAIAGPMLGFPAETMRLQELLIKMLNTAKLRFPNLRIAYLSSRTYGGYAISRLNPEPYAYESAFAIRWLIQEQQHARPELNFDAAKGEVKAPLVLWGPYLWAAGSKPRQADGFTWLKSDTFEDGIRPGQTGSTKIGELLLKFFKSDVNTRKWFLQPE